ncbi:MAG TPA: M15 family metallopeptidase [Flavisolibacter sp.]
MKKYNAYCSQVRGDSLQRMTELKSLIPGIVYDLRYATTNNFTGRQLYRQGSNTFMRVQPARALARVQDTLRRMGLGLKILDAYRPYAATKLMWELVGDERYVAHPKNGSNHNRGLAVDLTLIELATGAELDMGTGFDHFSDTAHHAFAALPDHARKNRALLRSLMEIHGFRALETEWWHYSWINDRNYQLLDIPFHKLSGRKL